MSSYNICVLHNLVAPVSIRAASSWIISKLRLFSRLQLSHIMSLYSNIDLTKVVYSLSKEGLSKMNCVALEPLIVCMHFLV